MKKVTLLLVATVLVASLVTIALAGEFEVNDIVEYKVLPSYTEAEELRQLVARGELPPVEQRLPKKPLVWKSKFMSDGPGMYGGQWRSFSAVPTEGWNWAGGQTQGWFGINMVLQEPLVRTGPMYLLKTPEPLPNLATSWEWSTDGKTLTMYLIEGAKWSDGVEFTADDILFTYYDCIVDPHVPHWASAGIWTMDGTVTELEKVDDYTIKWHFGVPFPIYIFYYMDYLEFSPAPKHVLAKHHPKYNPDATYEDFIHALPPEDIPPVTLGPWVPVRYVPDRLLVMRRNPYYWQVDETGKQLPYINEVSWERGKSGETRTLNLMAGTCDDTNLENPEVLSLALQKAQSPDAHYRVIVGRFTNLFHFSLNMSLYKGVKTDRDRAVRKLFRDLRFRKALSYAVDREGLASAAMPGPWLRPFPGSFPVGASYYDPDAVVSYPYDPEKSKALLSELGFKDTDGDGIANWSKETLLSGQNLIIAAIIPEDVSAAVEIGEGLVPLFREVGIKLMPKPLKSPVVNAKVNAAEFEIFITRPNWLATPFAHLTDLGPVTSMTPDWHQAGPEEKRDLLPFESRIKDLLEQVKTEVSAEQRRKIFSQVQKLWTENLYTIGVYQQRFPWAVAKRFKNVPKNCPAYFIQWNWINAIYQQLWVSKEDQLPELVPGVIPTYEK